MIGIFVISQIVVYIYKYMSSASGPTSNLDMSVALKKMKKKYIYQNICTKRSRPSCKKFWYTHFKTRTLFSMVHLFSDRKLIM